MISSNQTSLYSSDVRLRFPLRRLLDVCPVAEYAE